MGLEEDLKKLYKERETAKVYITTYKKMLSNIRLAIYTIKKEIRDEKRQKSYPKPASDWTWKFQYWRRNHADDWLRWWIDRNRSVSVLSKGPRNIGAFFNVSALYRHQSSKLTNTNFHRIHFSQ